jgi:hypothetical protein
MRNTSRPKQNFSEQQNFGQGFRRNGASPEHVKGQWRIYLQETSSDPSSRHEMLELFQARQRVA